MEPEPESTNGAQAALARAVREQLMARGKGELAEYLRAWPYFGSLTVRQALQTLNTIPPIDREPLTEQLGDRSLPPDH